MLFAFFCKAKIAAILTETTSTKQQIESTINTNFKPLVSTITSSLAYYIYIYI